ncbi:MAG: precorrin-4 C(11)-methyltransferase, partial [Actinomycetia bacterium]|nr:precorrin-4 C(11)-methyltransferase [Actinomycetes bacterium]
MIVSFIGAGPGDPELITLKGYNRIKNADVIIYAGSLINPAILKSAGKSTVRYDSKDMTLSEIIDLIAEKTKSGKKVTRLHTGDISIYSSLIEQLKPLEKKGINIEIIPGVSSYQAAAARIKKEYTVPGGTQTLILSRIKGRTPVPEGESLKKLLKHHSSIALFLSMEMFKDILNELRAELPIDTPIAICHKISWPGELIIMGTVDNIEEKIKDLDLRYTTLILIGNFLRGNNTKSKLYDKDFS